MLTEFRPAQPMPRLTRFLLACGAVGPTLFILVFLFEDVTRPDYNAWRQMVSALSLSSHGWLQIANFLVCGTLVLGFAGGLRQVLRPGRGAVWGPVLLAVFGASLLIAGFFVTDPSLGYPPGSAGAVQTLHGTIYGVNAPLAFGSLTLAIIVFARRFARDPAWRGWAWYSLAAAILFVGAFIASLSAAVLAQTGAVPNAPAGLLERLAILIGWSWIALLALRILRELRASTQVPGPA